MKRDAASMLDQAREAAAAVATLSSLAEKTRREAVLAAVDAKMSQSDIARRLGISQECVSEIIDQVVPADEPVSPPGENRTSST